MQVIADLHIHGPYSRATSRDITIQNLEKYARIKGLDILGTGDFTHPNWMKILKENLTDEHGEGILKSSSGFSFMLSAEVCNIYDQEKKTRKIHNVILAKDFGTADQINEFLAKRTDLSYDGRPIIHRMTCPELVEGLISISKDVVIIPGHAWTPWFGIFGSKSGFDSVEECFGDQSRHIFALETGMSSDPAMNWRLSSLDRYSLVSFSDAHSFWPWRIGREACAFELEKASYDNIMKAIRDKDAKRFSYTIEVNPAYGKYHFDGHRDCGIHLEPKESLKMKNICPVCRRPMTIGVLHRVGELADRPEGYKPEGAVPFTSLLPLTEIIAAAAGISQLSSSRIWAEYDKLVKAFGTELNVLMNAKDEELKKVADKKTAELILLVRDGKVKINPGFDGVYGSLVVENAKHEEKRPVSPQKRIDQF
jgi:uncharacterized protein (TIGR00375 family)